MRSASGAISLLARRIAGVLLVLFALALAISWVRSYFVIDMFRFDTARRWHFIDLRTGAIQYGTFLKSDSGGRNPRYWTTGPKTFEMVWSGWVQGAKHYVSFAGFQLLISHPAIPSYVTFCIPSWFLILSTALPGALLLRSSCRHIPGTCVKCGYDLRASKERCPECGTPIAVTPARGEG